MTHHDEFFGAFKLRAQASNRSSIQEERVCSWIEIKKGDKRIIFETESDFEMATIKFIDKNREISNMSMDILFQIINEFMQ